MERFNSMSQTTKYILLGIVGFLLLTCVLSITIIGSVVSVRNQGIQRENRLSAQYLDNQNYLSAYISGFYEQTGIAVTASDTLNQILLDAVKGRYGEEGFGSGSSVFNVIVEAYPDLSQNQQLWANIQNYIAAGRAEYRNIQSKLLDMLREYDTWRETGFIKPILTNIMGYPTTRLEARIGETTFTGELARDKMYQIVLTSQAIDAYEDGVMDPLTVPTRTP